MLQNQVKSLDVCWLIETNESFNWLIVCAHFLIILLFLTYFVAHLVFTLNHT
jgi:hypothetical protein